MMTKKITAIFSLMLMLISGCIFLFFHPTKELTINPYLKNVICEDIFFKTSDGLTLHGWLLKPKNKSLGTILHLHGNAENIGSHVGNVLWLVLEGYTVFSFDYRGYGKSEGHTTIDGVHIDAQAALEKAISLSSDNSGNIIVFGQSLGGAIAVYTAANTPNKKNIKALIIDSTFSSYRKITREKASQILLTWPIQYPLSFLVSNYYSPVNWIKKIKPVPLLIIHGRYDRLVPVHHGLQLYEEASEPRKIWITEIKGHIVSFADKEVREKFLNYLKDVNPA